MFHKSVRKPLIVPLLCLALTSLVRAEEGGSGHYATKLCGKYDLVTEIKWLPELDVEKRTDGDYVWCKLALVF